MIKVDRAEFIDNHLTSVATLSNCGEFLKPSDTKQLLKDSCGRGNDLGYGKSTEGYKQWIIRSQVLSPSWEVGSHLQLTQLDYLVLPTKDMDAVQRLDGSGSLVWMPYWTFH